MHAGISSAILLIFFPNNIAIPLTIRQEIISGTPHDISQIVFFVIPSAISSKIRPRIFSGISKQIYLDFETNYFQDFFSHFFAITLAVILREISS